MRVGIAINRSEAYRYANTINCFEIWRCILNVLSESRELPVEFDEKLWNATVERLTVYEDERLVFSHEDSS